MSRAVKVHTPIAKALQKLGIPEPIASFPVYPAAKTGYYFLVWVFATDQQFRKRLAYELPDHPHTKESLAHVQQLCDGKLLGKAYFPLRSCVDGVVSHEMFHCVMRLVWYQGIDGESIAAWGSQNHERAAEALENLVAGFWEGYTKAGLKRQHCLGWPK